MSNAGLAPVRQQRKENTRCDHHGFTLVELVVMIVITGLIAAVVGPRFAEVSVFRQHGFYDEMITSVRYAQKYAVASGCTVQVSITANSYTLSRGAACNTAPFDIPLADPAGSAGGYTRNAPDGVALTPVVFNFLSGGSATVASPSQVIAVGTQSFTVWAATGFVQ